MSEFRVLYTKMKGVVTQYAMTVRAQSEVDPSSAAGDLDVLPAKPALKRPSLYQVVLLNDDYTPMDFVIDVLMRFFDMPEDKATQVMLAVHTAGKGVCGVYTRDVAETKSYLVNELAAENEHPLLCKIEALN